MVAEIPADAQEDPGWLLEDLAGRVPGARGVVLLSLDGLAMASHGLGPDDADPVAASASALFSIAGGVARRFGKTDGVRQVVAELADALLFVSAAGSGAALAVLADPGTDAGVLGYEMTQLARACAPFLAAARRSRGAITVPARGGPRRTGPR
jgi:predicted regulator of Ras-like GTPase activity (Roadblock/LC7/MglB family)